MSRRLQLYQLAWLLAGLAGAVRSPAELLPQSASMEELIAALGSDDSNQWSRSTTFLHLRGAAGKPAVPALIRALDNPRKRGSALYALRGIGPAAIEAVPDLLTGIARWTDDSAARWSAAAVLSDIGPAARPALRAAAAGDNLTVALWAHAALAKQMALEGTTEFTDEHLSFLAQPLLISRSNGSAEALRAIQMIGPAAAPLIPNLQAARADGIISIGDLVETLRQMGPAGDIIESILPALESNDSFTRLRGVQTLAQIGTPRDQAALPALLAMIESPSSAQHRETMRIDAIRAVGRVGAGDPRVRAALLSVTREDAIPGITYIALTILFQQCPVDDDAIAFFIDHVRTNATEFENRLTSDYIGQVPPSDGFIDRLSPANHGSVHRFETLARDFPDRPGIQRLIRQALRKMEATPEVARHP